MAPPITEIRYFILCFNSRKPMHERTSLLKTKLAQPTSRDAVGCCATDLMCSWLWARIPAKALCRLSSKLACQRIVVAGSTARNLSPALKISRPSLLAPTCGLFMHGAGVGRVRILFACPIERDEVYFSRGIGHEVIRVGGWAVEGGRGRTPSYRRGNWPAELTYLLRRLGAPRRRLSHGLPSLTASSAGRPLCHPHSHTTPFTSQPRTFAAKPRENPPTSGIVRCGARMRKSRGGVAPGFEPGSPWWEASSLTTASTRPQYVEGLMEVFKLYIGPRWCSVQTNNLPPRCTVWRPDFRLWKSSRTMPLVGGFSRGSPFSPALTMLRADQISPLGSLYEALLKCLRRAKSCDKLSKGSAIAADENEFSRKGPCFGSTRIPYTSAKLLDQTVVLRSASERRYALRNRRVGETGDSRENPPTSGTKLIPKNLTRVTETSGLVSLQVWSDAGMHGEGNTEESEKTSLVIEPGSSLWKISDLTGNTHMQCADETMYRLFTLNVGMPGRGKREIPGKTRESVASPATIPTSENLGATPLEIDPYLRIWEASSQSTGPPWPPHHTEYQPSFMQIHLSYCQINTRKGFCIANKIVGKLLTVVGKLLTVVGKLLTVVGKLLTVVGKLLTVVGKLLTVVGKREKLAEGKIAISQDGPLQTKTGPWMELVIVLSRFASSTQDCEKGSIKHERQEEGRMQDGEGRVTCGDVVVLGKLSPSYTPATYITLLRALQGGEVWTRCVARPQHRHNQISAWSNNVKESLLISTRLQIFARKSVPYSRLRKD
ncbi:hypothetical protein PR048_022593 [Dryococelus australis]|uniref:Uncharacterized protein n=1 Tax=Dryococelus australis TaxID=614101 RepID=A0ABQ9H1H5_9NEOP|nr:hypothetical protein PR048_022593 [Dryococelus australis]